ncbi:MAG: ArnT family glycosyltransferase [Bacteriovoracaceae bacterium]
MLIQNRNLTLAKSIWGFCLAFGILSRFWNITNIGISGSDAFFYWQTAYEWAFQKIQLNEHYRPFVYSIYALALKVFGANDWPIKLMNVIYDLLAGLMTYKVYVTYFKDKMGAITASSIYLILPTFIMWSRLEEVHTPSILFILCSLYFFHPSIHQRRWYNFFLSGMFLSFAWNTHPDLAVLVPVFLLFLFIFNGGDFYDIATFGLIFLLGVFSVFIAFSFIVSPAELLVNIVSNHSAQKNPVTDAWIIKFFTVYYRYISENLSPLITLIFTIVFISSFVKKSYRSINSLFLISLVLFYCLMCSLLFSRVYLARLLLPLCPVILIVCINFALQFKKFKYYLLLLVGVASIYPHTSTIFSPYTQEFSYYKQLDEFIGKEVNSENKILIAPFIFYHIHSPLHKNIYLNGNGIYIPLDEGNSFKEIVEKNHVTYFVWAKKLHDHRIFGINIKSKYIEKIRNVYRMEPGQYSVEKDQAFFNQQLRELGAIQIADNQLGTFYKIIKNSKEDK